MLYQECRHVMTSGKKCEAPALKGEHYCYYHTRQHIAANKKISPQDSIEIPVKEDRYSLQLVLAQVLRHLVNNNIDRHRAGLLLYGLQIASQTVDRRSMAPLGRVVKSVTHTHEGDELAPEDFDCEAGDYCTTCPRAEECRSYDPDNDGGPDDDED
ncbi:MAG: hypothetical protein ACLP07_08840 [Terracidiphilus sp.]